MSDKSTMDFSARAPGPFDLTADRGNLHGKQRSQESNQVGTGSQQSDTFRDTCRDTFYIFLPHPFLYTSFFHFLPKVTAQSVPLCFCSAGIPSGSTKLVQFSEFSQSSLSFSVPCFWSWMIEAWPEKPRTGQMLG